MVAYPEKPRWSRIVYEALGTIWLADGSGNIESADEGSDFESSRLSRDGRSIASVVWDDDSGRIRSSASAGAKAAPSPPSPGIMSSPPFPPTEA